MRPRYWILILLFATAVHSWLFFHLDPEKYPALSFFAIGVHVAACIGPFWMLFDWFIKNEKRLLKQWMWLVFVPWGFLWYYFEVHRAMISKRNQVKHYS